MWVAANRSQHRPIRIAGSIEAPPRGREARGPRPECCEHLEYFEYSVKTGRSKPCLRRAFAAKCDPRVETGRRAPALRSRQCRSTLFREPGPGRLCQHKVEMSASAPSRDAREAHEQRRVVSALIGLGSPRPAWHGACPILLFQR